MMFGWFPFDFWCDKWTARPFIFAAGLGGHSPIVFPFINRGKQNNWAENICTENCKLICIWLPSLCLICSQYPFWMLKCFFLKHNYMLNPKMAVLMTLDWQIWHKLWVFMVTAKFHISLKNRKSGLNPKLFITQI